MWVRGDGLIDLWSDPRLPCDGDDDDDDDDDDDRVLDAILYYNIT